MVWVTSIADVLNQWAAMGVFSYLIPFLLIFAVVFAILDKSNILGENKAIKALVGAAVGLLALQFDFVSTFFATIFPRLGVVLAVLLALVILVGLSGKDSESSKLYYVVGIVLAVAIVLWTLSAWDFWGDEFGISWWFQENFWWLVIGAAVVVAIGFIISQSKSTSHEKKQNG